VGHVPELRELVGRDGSCVNLQPDNTCAIYEDRPSACRVDDAQPAVMTTAEWYRRNEDACQTLHLQVYGAPMRTP
jgi:Fe-S-cluster containining protein